MGRLIKAEFLKMSKSLGYKVLLLCAAAMGTLVAYIVTIPEINPEMSGSLVYLQILTEIQSQAIYASIFAAIFICNEFSNRTFGVGILSGCSRLSLLLSKAVAYIIGIVSIIFTYPIVGTVIVSIRLGFGDMNAEQWQHLALTTFLFVMGVIAMGSFCFMLAMIIKNVGGTIGAGIGLLVGLILAGQFPQLSPVMKFAFTYQLERAAQPDSMALYYAVISATILISLITSRLIFERSELK